MCVGRWPWYDRLVTTTGPPELPEWLRNCPPTIVAEHGSTLIWTTSTVVDHDQLSAMWDLLSSWLPGIRVLIVSGISGVALAAPGACAVVPPTPGEPT